ncbi:MAG: copper resistance CopC family protein, partial [Thermoleophilia bacterium]
MLVALIAILACLPAGASAHLDFASSSPSGGSVADSPVQRVTLTFTKEGRLVAPGIRLLDSGGAPIAAEVSPASTGASFTVTPASPLGPGRYGVGWRIAAPDAHPKAGSFTFEVRSTAGADAAPTPAAPASTDDGDLLDQALAAPSTDGPRALRSVARVLMYAGTLLALGAMLFIA